MDRDATEHTWPEELRTLVTLEGLSGVSEVRSFANGFSVAFAEADFVVRMSSPGPDPDTDLGPEPACETEWEVTVREAQPGLSTWWGRWHRSFDVPPADAGPLIVDEVCEAIARVRGMLEDRARGLAERPMQPA